MKEKPKHPAAIALGRLGGKARSEKKAAASRENLKKAVKAKQLKNRKP